MTAVDNFEDLLGAPMPGNTAAPVVIDRVAGAAGKESAIAGDAYEGASNFSREVAMWQPPTRSADNDMLPQKRKADARVRDMDRNDAYLHSGITMQQDNIVGGRYTLNAKPATSILLGSEDDTWEEEFQQEVETLFSLYAESDECWIDAGRRHTLTGLIRQATGMYALMGENLGIVEWAREDNSMRAFNTSVRIVDLDRLSTPPDKNDDPYCVAGVQLDQRHIAQGYHIRQAHESDYRMADKNMQWTYVPLRKPWGRRQAFHMFDQRRPGQTRGMSDMVTGLSELKMMRDFRSAALQNAFVQATYAATIESDLDTQAIFTRLGGGNLDDDFNIIGQYMSQYLGAVNAYMGDAKNFKLGGVKIPHLPPGSKLNLQPAMKSGALGTELEQSLLRYMAALLGISYEQLAKDFTNTNYSSARAAMVETWKFMQSRKALVADRFASMIYRLWMEEALNKGLIFAGKYRKLPNFYAPMMADAYCRCEWIGAARGQIDELKETQAAALRSKYNLSTDEQEAARTGNDWRSIYKQKARELKERERLGINMLDQNSNDLNATTGEPNDAAGGGSKKKSKSKASAQEDDLDLLGAM